MCTKYRFEKFPCDREQAAKLLSSFVKSTKKFAKSGILNAKIIDTPVGSIIAISNEKNLVMLKFFNSKHLDGAIKNLIKLESKAIVENDDAKPLSTLEVELQRYFSGKLIDFKTPYEINESENQFQRSVWNQIIKIGFCQLKGHADLAEAIKNPRAVRAVANVCDKNPIEIIIPSHRVAESGCSMYSFMMGLGLHGSDYKRKKYLICLERKHKKKNLV